MEETEKQLTLLFEWLKQLTTLNAGSIVLIGSFLQGIFPSKDGILTVGLGIKLLIGAAFVFFGFSLMMSVFSMWFHTSKFRESRQGASVYDRGEWIVFLTLPLLSFLLAVVCFGAAVLSNLF